MFKSLLKGFKYAFSGIVSAVINERNMRIHFVAAVYVVWFSRFYNFTKTEYAVLFIVITMVIASELINTAIESAVDISSTGYNRKAKISKDASAGAVLFSAVCAVAVGILFFADYNVLNEIFNYFAHSLIRLTLLILSIILSIFFIFFLFPAKNSNHIDNNKEKQ